MTETEMLGRMVPPGKRRPDRYRGGILQIHITRACDKSCFHCTQGSNLAGKPVMMTPGQFEQACNSLQGYFGVIGIFGGNPCIHPQFAEICEIFRAKFPLEQRGLWSNHPLGKGKICAETFYPRHSNLNVHCDPTAFGEFAKFWPASLPFLKGLADDSRHGSPYVSREDVGKSPDEIAEGTATCEVNQFWSAILGVLDNQVYGFFCELAYFFAVLHADDPDWKHAGIPAVPDWWHRPMNDFADQVRQACRHCGMPNKSFGQLAQGGEREQVSKTHAPWFKPKQKDRLVQLVSKVEEIQEKGLPSAILYIENGSLPNAV